MNTLHNEKSNKSNALAESQINNTVFKKIEVIRPASGYIQNRIVNNDEGCLIVLTGHAGDGKTTLLYQTLESLNVKPNGKAVNETVQLESGKQLHFVKDFSELTAYDRKIIFQEALEDSNKGVYTIIVANTGPLIDTFKTVFENEENAEAEIINCIDSVENYEKKVHGYSLLVLNIALLDNTNFIEPYIENILSFDAWSKCEECADSNKCPVYRNIRLLRSHKQALEFVRDFYIWELEHDRRATIRQISAHIAYSITGGLTCSDIAVKNFKSTDYLFSNLLFGDIGQSRKKQASQIRGIKMINDLRLDSVSTTFDYALYVQKKYNDIFVEDADVANVYSYLDGVSNKKISNDDKRTQLKRLMLVFSRNLEEEREQLYQDIFSTYYPKYLKMRKGFLKPKSDLKKMIYQALRITFAGIGKEEEDIYITLRRSGENIQNVQLLIGRININDLDVVSIQLNNSDVAGQAIYRLELRYNGGIAKKSILVTLPLLNYFEKIVKGMIITRIDPLLSYGIESLKSELLSVCSRTSLDGNEIEVLVQTDEGCRRRKMHFEANRISSS